MVVWHEWILRIFCATALMTMSGSTDSTKPEREPYTIVTGIDSPQSVEDLRRILRLALDSGDLSDRVYERILAILEDESASYSDIVEELERIYRSE